MKIAGRGCLSAALLLITTACSTTAYQKEIKGFSETSAALSATYSEGRTQLQKDREGIRNAQWSLYKYKLIAPQPCQEILDLDGDKRPDPCVISAINRQGKPAVDYKYTSKEEENVDKAQGIFNALSQYAVALTAISASEDSAEFKKQWDGLASSVEGLVGAAVSYDSSFTSAAPFISPVGKLIGTAVSAYYERQRMEALRDAVTGADQVLQTLAGHANVALSGLRDLRIEALTTLVSESLELVNAEGQSSYEYYHHLSEAEGAITARNALITSSPSDAFKALADAHAKLKDALSVDKPELVAFAASLADFAGKVDALRKVIAAEAKK